MRVIIADDDKTTLKTLQAFVSRLGHDPIAVEDGRAAFEAFNADENLRLALLDWNMPGMSGVEICREIRKRELDVQPYLILLTSKDTAENIAEGLEAGANDYMVKPCSGTELRARIQVGERMVELQESLSRRVKELEEALTHIKTLQGLLPICSYCHKIRDDKDTWLRMEQYIEGHSQAEFSHSICDECLEKHFPEDEFE